MILTREQPPLITLIGHLSEKTIAIHLNVIDGEKFGEEQLFLGLVQKSITTHLLNGDVKVVALILDSNHISLFPTSASIENRFLETPFYFYISGGVGSTFLEGRVNSALTSANTISTRVTWRFDLPKNEVIAAITAPTSSTVANVGRVLGDRRVLYKYLNPNLIAVLSLLELEKESTLFAYLLDAVSGTIHQTHIFRGAGNVPSGTASIKAIMCENFFVFSYWRMNREIPSNSNHFEVVVLELYQSKRPDIRFNRGNHSSFHSDRLESISKTFVTPHSLSSIGVTLTAAGIASKELLCKLALIYIVAYKHGILQGVSRKVLDPRRPARALNNADKEEMLIPYHPLLTVNPREVATQQHQVFGISSILSSATLLESTSIVLASGIDIFCSKRMPSRQFDKLSENFSYVQLVASILVLTAAVIYTNRLAEKKRLKDLLE